MGQNREPIFIDVPFTEVTTVAEIAIARNPPATTGMSLLVSAGSDGALVEEIRFVPLGTNALTVARIFYTLSETSVPGLLQEVTLQPVTASATEAIPETIVQLPRILVGQNGNRGLRLSPGSTLWVALSVPVSSGYNVVASGGRY